MKLQFLKINFYILPILLLFIFSCGEEGEVGPKGPQGDKGANGPDGSAPKGEQGPNGADGMQGEKGLKGVKGDTGDPNVTLYIFGSHDFSTTSSVSLDISDMDEPTFNMTMWTVYVENEAGLFFVVPGYGTQGLSEYRVYFSYSEANGARAHIKVSSGTGEAYAKIKVIGMPAGNLVNAKIGLDMTDYHAVAKHYGLKE